jgi:formiminotetrahydrofolate cyclodeaminase|tara:strand:- start:189 stop:455 length:267 start_codon:yes stop_codon:yes gene_type:complete
VSITHEEAVKAAQAEAILDSDVFAEALENLKNEYTNIWLNTRDIKDTQIREDLHRSLLLLPEVERHLRIMVEKGKLTKTHINKIRNIG